MKGIMIHHMFYRILIVLSSWAPPMHMFVPFKCEKESIQNAPVEKRELQKAILKPMKCQHLDLLKSMYKSYSCPFF